MKTRSEIETIVASLLEKHNILEAPVPVDAIAQHEGLRVVQASFGGDVSGALIRSSGVVGIAVNSSQSPVRQRFTIAHELGHHAFGHMPNQDHIDWEFSVLRRDDLSAAGTNVFEIEANAFAANLLMPTSFLVKDLKPYLNRNSVLELSDEERSALARKYKVSDTALGYRLTNLGYIAPF